MAHDPHRYAKLELERRFLLSPATLPPLSREYAHYDDLYLTGTQLRLRVMTEQPGGRVIYKLTQKLQDVDPRIRRITTLYLTEREHRLLAALPAARLSKRRHRAESGALAWGVDLFEGSLAGLVLAEREFESEAELRSARPPLFAALEVTDDAAFTGGALAAGDPARALARAAALLARTRAH